MQKCKYASGIFGYKRTFVCIVEGFVLFFRKPISTLFRKSDIMAGKLTAKQQMILDVLKAEIRRNGYPPTVREICDAVGLSSTSTVHSHLETLERKGHIRRSPTKNRSTEILEEGFYNNSRELVNIPIVVRVAAGVPILTEENIEDTFPIPIDYVKNDTCFMLPVKGNSMVDEGILDGDLVLVRQQQNASDGDIIIALLDDSATVKFFSCDEEFIRTDPANAVFEPIRVRECEVLGKVIGLYRRY